MQLISIEQVFKILKPGVPLPWGVRDAKGNLLLGKGHVLEDQTKLISLLNRGMFVEAEEVKKYINSNPSRAGAPPPKHVAEEFFSRWEVWQRNLGSMLRTTGAPDFLEQIQKTVGEIAATDERLSDQALYMILRHDYKKYEDYAEAHSLHVAVLCLLISRRLGWSDERRYSAIGAALTMNLAMMDLQTRLAGQNSTLTLLQRKEINAHPTTSTELLRVAGLKDEEWLSAVEQHHEVPGGKGYPRKLQEPTELSQLLRIIDTFAAKHSGRIGRSQQPAQQAARDLYAQNSGHPVAAALIKECGIYPPGTYVKLANREVAIVTNRGASAKEPVVAAIVSPTGDTFTRPPKRDTSTPAYAIVDTVPESLVKMRVSVRQLYE